jgi:hypothetical protein
VSEYKNARDQTNITVKNKKLLDRFISLIDYLLEMGYDVSLGESRGDPLLHYKSIEYIINGISNKDRLSQQLDYEILSSYRFDEKNNYRAVFKLLNQFENLFDLNNIQANIRWSIHLEYYNSTMEVKHHYERLKKSTKLPITKLVMLNTVKDVVSYQLISKILPDVTHAHFVVDNVGEVPLIHELNANQLEVLRKLNYNVRGKNIVDRMVDGDFTFMGTTCHLPAGVSITEGAEVFKCTNLFYNWFDRSKTIPYPDVKSIFNMTNEQIVELGVANMKCPFSKCNICTYDPIEI